MKNFGRRTKEGFWDNRITSLLEIKLPIIQGGMIWAAGWELASAVSNHGGLGTLGAGSMYPEVLQNQIQKCKKATSQNFAVNLPLLYPSIEEHLETILKNKIPIVITSAGNPKKYTKMLQSEGVIVGHVVANKKFALKCQEAGVDFIIAEGFEAGGHNGREELTTLNLLSALRDIVDVPLIAAGGIWDSASMLACMVLGAEAVQMGSRFVCSKEASCHENFKNSVIQSDEGQTSLRLKQLTPVRLLENKFAQKIAEMEGACASPEELKAYLGRGRAKLGMMEGDLNEGELEIGQNAMLLDDILSVEDIMQKTWLGFQHLLEDLSKI